MMNCPGQPFMQPYEPQEPLTAEQRSEIYAQLRAQYLEVLKTGGKEVKTVCVCGKGISLFFAYRCFYCGRLFCKECAREHFSVPDSWNPNARYLEGK